MSSSWRDLQAPYFERVCRSVLDVPMAMHGFEVLDSSNAHVVYASGKSFLECSYYAEDSPTYNLMINVGLLCRESGGQVALDGVGLWKFLPKPSARRGADTGTWLFADELALERLLLQFVGKIIEQVALPILAEPAKLRAALDAQRLELDDSHANAVQLEQLARARKAYEAGRYAEAASCYEQITPRLMLPSDSKKLELARRWVGDNEEKPHGA